jgi:hypothetical protein
LPRGRPILSRYASSIANTAKYSGDRKPIVNGVSRQVSVLVKGRRGPIFADCGESVREDGKLSHDHYDGDLSRFSGFGHGLIFGFEFRVASDRGDGGHVESLSGSRAAATDGSFLTPGGGTVIGVGAFSAYGGLAPLRYAATAGFDFTPSQSRSV